MCRWTCALNDWHSGLEHDKIRQKLGVSKIQWREISMKLERPVKRLKDLWGFETRKVWLGALYPAIPRFRSSSG